MPVTEFGFDEIAEAAKELKHESPATILRWAVETFYPHLTMGTAFGAEGCCVIHLLAEINPSVRIFNLETGYQFPETLQLRERIKEKYGIAVEYVRPETTVAEYEAIHNGPLYVIDSNKCCQDRKIGLVRGAVEGYKAWISSIRGDQTKDRAGAEVVQWDRKFNLVKINPLLQWTKRDVWNFVFENDVPYNELHDMNYPSIGCWPCTRSVLEGEDERAGRWAGTAKKECGLHVLEHQDGSGI